MDNPLEESGTAAKKTNSTVIFGIIALIAVAVPVVILQMPAGSPPSSTPCMASLKMLATANLQYLEDHNNRMPPDQNLKSSLASYMKAPIVDSCPDTKIPFRMNSLLFGMDVSQVEDNKKTVFLYEGEEWSLTGPHGGFSTVAFLGGNVAAFSKEKPPAFEVRIKQLPPK